MNRTGENQKLPLQLSFNRFLRVGFQRSRVSSNGGSILVRELDERLGFGELIDEHLTDFRADNARFSLADPLRRSVYSRLAGYEDVNDAERLSQDPTFRLIGSERMDLWEKGSYSVGSKGLYIFDRRKAKREIPVKTLRMEEEPWLARKIVRIVQHVAVS